jgi:protein phosphatase
VLSAHADREIAANTLVQAALRHGGSDNITVVVADIEESEPLASTSAEIAAVEESLADASTTDEPIREASVDSAPPATAHLDATPSALSAATIQTAVAPSHVSRPADPFPRRARVQPAERHPVREIENLVTIRVVAFVLVLMVIFGGIIGFTVWFNRASYYVGLKDGYVTIFEGRPGGFLWFKPTVARETSLSLGAILDSSRPLVTAGVLEPSYDKAQQVVDALTNEQSILGLPTITTTTTTTSTSTTTTVAKAKVTTTTTKRG